MPIRNALAPLAALVAAVPLHAHPLPPGCSGGWRITGYYAPQEEEMPGPAQAVQVPDHGRKSYPMPFLKAVKMEGWGKTREGWYLGWSSNRWHASKYAEDAEGRELVPGSVAADRKLFASGATIKIPSAPAPWNGTVFTVRDVGGAIKGKHIDIYAGIGKRAEVETFKVTTPKGHDNGTVCKG